MIQKQGAVEVVHFVGEYPSEDTGPFHLAPRSVPIQPPHHGARGPAYRRIESGEAEAPFVLPLGTFAPHPFRIDHDEQCVGVVSARRVRHQDPLRNTHLRRCQTNPPGGVHGLDHVVDQRLGICRDLLNFDRRPLKPFVAESQDLPEHGAIVVRTETLSADRLAPGEAGFAGAPMLAWILPTLEVP